MGATYGDPAGTRTRLRNYWSNQETGIVDDAVYELMMKPKNWGEIVLEVTRFQSQSKCADQCASLATEKYA